MQILIFIITLCYCSTAVTQSSSISKKQLQFCYCAYPSPPENLGLDTLFLLNNFFFQNLQSTSTKGYKSTAYKENIHHNCITYSIYLPSKKYHYYYVNTYTLDTLFIPINLTKDTLIDLNALAENYYQKISTNASLLEDIKTGDKISLAYSYHDCPADQSTFFITLLALNDNECKIISQNSKQKKRKTVVKLTALQQLEKQVRELPFGKGLKVQIRKNKHYQVFKHTLPPYTALSTLIQAFQSLHQ